MKTPTQVPLAYVGSQLSTLEQGDGGLTVRFEASGGLYQFTVVWDGRDYDWEQMYIINDLWGNRGQRTGPWDFHCKEDARPVVPSYWVKLDGNELGLWYAQRISLEDLQRRMFRGRLAFQIRRPGEHTLELRPYQPCQVRCISMQLEVDPEDRLLADVSKIAGAQERSPAAAWARPGFWPAQRERLRGSHRSYQHCLQEMFKWVAGKRLEECQPYYIPLLLASQELGDNAQGIATALEVLDRYISLPAWGNPRRDGYSHNGDMWAADTLRSLAWAYHMFGEELGEVRRLRLLEKLRVQGEVFLAQALLMRDYWGGSLLQDHGWQSLFTFGTAALHLLGVIPEATEWVSYALPRIDRALAAMARDGVIPNASHHSLSLFLDPLCFYREALLAQAGRDIFDEAPLRLVVDYLYQVLDENKDWFPLWGTTVDAGRFTGAIQFFNLIASKYRDGRAAALSQRLVSQPDPTLEHPNGRARAEVFGALWGFLTYDPTVSPSWPVRPVRRLVHFPDSGVVHYLDEQQKLAVSLRCGPWAGYHAQQHACGPCDRMEIVPAPGHFTLALDGQMLLCSPDQGYRLHSFLRNTLLIDDQGAYGDIGYPMSIPSYRHRGEEIDSVQWDEQTQSGSVRLNLQPAYPEASGVALYTRQLFFSREQRIVMRDQVILDRPRKLSWLFQGRRDQGVCVLEGLTACIAQSPRLQVAARPQEVELSASTHETDCVRSYVAQWGTVVQYDHVRYDTVAPTAAAVVDFILTW